MDPGELKPRFDVLRMRLEIGAEFTRCGCVVFELDGRVRAPQRCFVRVPAALRHDLSGFFRARVEANHAFISGEGQIGALEAVVAAGEVQGHRGRGRARAVRAGDRGEFGHTLAAPIQTDEGSAESYSCDPVRAFSFEVAPVAGNGGVVVARPLVVLGRAEDRTGRGLGLLGQALEKPRRLGEAPGR